MKKSTKLDLFEKIKNFQKTVLSNRPETSTMLHDIRMMNFKIRPLAGEISQLDLQNPEFIGALWSLGKLDDFFRQEFFKLPDQEKEVFFRLVDELRYEFQQQINTVGVLPERELSGDQNHHPFEVEIIKEMQVRVN